MKRQTWYGIATTAILLGVVLMCQPFSELLYSSGFPVILAGVILFIVLDHLSPPKPKSDPSA
ncbi:MAG TPA: hypothetical protein VHL31_25885 [Geminicoccus sp.]|jgi:hypothetical protein|uniref:hypothetical protein n=1 Tax=Geminicoccus sp. TaxID=2024832 RepID=UPI002E327142|nr:hypothetical protein [Geminicoccus sp.]HEX2529706.1 hypothetical protein [Geminicoccus sp.]